jgi:hypothetical protein
MLAVSSREYEAAQNLVTMYVSSEANLNARALGRALATQSSSAGRFCAGDVQRAFALYRHLALGLSTGTTAAAAAAFCGNLPASVSTAELEGVAATTPNRLLRRFLRVLLQFTALAAAARAPDPGALWRRVLQDQQLPTVLAQRLTPTVMPAHVVGPCPLVPLLALEELPHQLEGCAQAVRASPTPLIHLMSSVCAEHVSDQLFVQLPTVLQLCQDSGLTSAVATLALVQEALSSRSPPAALEGFHTSLRETHIGDRAVVGLTHFVFGQPHRLPHTRVHLE